MPVPNVPEDFEQIHIPDRIVKIMEEQNISVREVVDTIHDPDRVSRDNQPGRWVAERSVGGGSVTQVIYAIRPRPSEPWDEEWAEIEAEHAVEVAAHTTDPSSAVELNTAAVVRAVTRTSSSGPPEHSP